MSDNKLDNDQINLVDEPDKTGHSWDGIEEYDNPMPRWWLWTLYFCCMWGFIYTLAMPAWPIYGNDGATRGFLDWSSRGELSKEIEEVSELRSDMNTKLVEASFDELLGNNDANEYAKNAGSAVFATWCSQCHGSGAAGVQAQGYPNLLDDDWLWGGDLESIHQTITHGIRSTSEETRYSYMPSFDEMFTDEELEELVNYVVSLEYEPEIDTESSAHISYLDNCSFCHGENGEGMPSEGAPSLKDAIWLYGSGYENVKKQILQPRNGVMPRWDDKLSPADIKAVSVYVHSLGGGE